MVLFICYTLQPWLASLRKGGKVSKRFGKVVWDHSSLVYHFFLVSIHLSLTALSQIDESLVVSKNDSSKGEF